MWFVVHDICLPAYRSIGVAFPCLEVNIANSLDRGFAVLLVRMNAAGDIAGVLGPDSVTWRISREAVLFLGAGRALLLQLAHPWVATAVADHSQVFANPIGRFHRTFRVMFTMIFGTLDQALKQSARGNA